MVLLWHKKLVRRKRRQTCKKALLKNFHLYFLKSDTKRTWIVEKVKNRHTAQSCQATSYGGSIFLNAAASVKTDDKIIATIWLRCCEKHTQGKFIWLQHNKNMNNSLEIYVTNFLWSVFIFSLLGRCCWGQTTDLGSFSEMCLQGQELQTKHPTNHSFWIAFAV